MPRFGAVTFALVVSSLGLMLLSVPVAAASMAARVRYVTTSDKIIALTFDDGWSPTRSLQIADILDEQRATGTFFPYANVVTGAESTWRNIATRFPIANHTTSHPNLNKLSAAGIFDEIDGGRRIIEAATGRPMVRLFRPPYMDYNDTVREQAYKAGFRTMVLWSVDSGDSIGYDAARVLKRAIQGEPGGIVLLHAGPPATVKALPGIIESYRSRGFRFVTLPEMLGMSWSRTATLPIGPSQPPAQPEPELPRDIALTAPVDRLTARNRLVAY